MFSYGHHKKSTEYTKYASCDVMDLTVSHRCYKQNFDYQTSLMTLHISPPVHCFPPA